MDEYGHADEAQVLAEAAGMKREHELLSCAAAALMDFAALAAPIGTTRKEALGLFPKALGLCREIEKVTQRSHNDHTTIT